MVRRWISLFVAELRANPWQLVALILAGHVVAWILNSLFVFGPYWVINRYRLGEPMPYWAEPIAGLCLLQGARYWWRWVVSPFVTGVFVAGFSHRRELAVITGMLLSELVATEVDAAVRRAAWQMVLSVAFIPLSYVMAFIAAILVRSIRSKQGNPPVPATQ